jgi:hypothetical protein
MSGLSGPVSNGIRSQTSGAHFRCAAKAGPSPCRAVGGEQIPRKLCYLGNSKLQHKSVGNAPLFNCIALIRK